MKKLIVARLLLGGALLVLLAGCGDDPELVGAGDDGEPVAGQPDESAEVATTEPLVLPTEAPASEPPRAPGDESTDPASPTDGDDPAVSGPAPEPTPTPELPGAAPEAPSGPAPGEGDADGWQRTRSWPDVLSPTVVQPEELLMAADGTTVLVRYWNGVEPCSVARVTVAERPDAVEVKLVVGANPDAAAISCIALVEAYEIAVELSEPLGDRALIAVDPPAEPAPPEDPFADAVFPVDHYVGLTLEEAEEMAAIEQRDLRVTRIDDEVFAVTMDFSPTRVNIELEDGLVVLATSG